MTESKSNNSSAKQNHKTAAAFAASAEEALDTIATASRETIEATGKASRESISEAYDKATSFGASTVEKSTEAFDNLAIEGKKNLEAMTTATAAVMTGVTAYNTLAVEGIKSSLNFNMDCFEKVLAVETPQDAAAVQVKALADAVDLSTAKSLELGQIVTDTYAKVGVQLKRRFDESVTTFTKSLV